MTLARWHTGTKAKTLQAIRDCERQNPDISDLMSEIEDEDGVKDWDFVVLECRICGHRHTAVVPCQMDDTDNECDNCGNMTADIIEQEDD